MEHKIKIMMEQRINVAELLKDCPKGMELDCLIFENLEFDHIDKDNGSYSIICRVKTEWSYNTHTFTEYGCYSTEKYSKCVIFPKGKTTWEGFIPPCKFKDGDVITVENECGVHIFIYNHTTNEYGGYGCYVTLTSLGNFKINNTCSGRTYRLATEEEKAKLFQAIKDNGYKWNSETKTLEKLTVPSTSEKFYIRIGDIPSEEKSSVYNGDIVVGYEDGVSVYDCVETDGLYRIVMPFPLKEGQGMTYECLIQEITQCRYEIENPRNVYLVSGIEVGKGNDNEPLIKNVKILKDLTEQFNTKNDNTKENKSLEKLVRPKFKVGDRIKKKYSNGDALLITDIADNYYIYICQKCGEIKVIEV